MCLSLSWLAFWSLLPGSSEQLYAAPHHWWRMAQESFHILEQIVESSIRVNGGSISPFDARELERMMVSRAVNRERFILRARSPPFEWKKLDHDIYLAALDKRTKEEVKVTTSGIMGSLANTYRSWCKFWPDGEYGDIRD